MTKLTDDEVGELLRETFADKEPLADHLPAATKRRSPAPVLLAVAAVLAVVAGVLYGVSRAGEPGKIPQVAATPVAIEDGDIWGAAIATITRSVEPEAGSWEAVEVFGTMVGIAQQSGATPQPGVTFTAADRVQIERAVSPIAPVRWNAPISPSSCIPGRVASVTVGPVLEKGDHQEVRIDLRRGCVGGVWGTYSLQKIDGAWKVIGGTGTLNQRVQCVNAGERAASPRPTC